MYVDTRDNLQLYPDTGKYATPSTGTSHCEVNLGTILNRPARAGAHIWPESCAHARPGARTGAHQPGEGAWTEVAGAGGEREGFGAFELI